MTGPQIAFLVGFSLVTIALVAVVLVMIAGARQVDGSSRVTWKVLRRIGRLPSERSEANRWAFYLHRFSGIGIFAFLFMHIFDVSLYAVSSPVYDEVHQLYGTAPMRIMECGLLGALVFHAFNGLRLVAIDVWDLHARAAIRGLTVVGLLTVVLTVAGSVVILEPVVR